MPLRGITTLLLCGLLVAAGCQRTPAPASVADTTVSEPADAIQRLARHLHDNDLVGFARDAVPPAEYAGLETAWREGRSRWPLTELPLDDKLVPMLAALAAPDAEKTLQSRFDRQIARPDRDLTEAARTLGLFGVPYVTNAGDSTRA